MHIVELHPDDARIADMLPVLADLRPHLTPTSFDAIYREGWPQGLRFVAAFDDDGSCLGVAGWRINALTIDGRKLYVDDLVTSAAVRSTGVGHALLTYLEDRAKTAGCAVIDLDSGVQRHDAHRFYLREPVETGGNYWPGSTGGL